ncbi:MAG: hypothetical protein HYS60_00410 [Candidatus Wildermuthbacteria bacterium]|nr:hypothetical protein [Candidatus Wildermuthbacteria bacterium]
MDNRIAFLVESPEKGIRILNEILQGWALKWGVLKAPPTLLEVIPHVEMLVQTQSLKTQPLEIKLSGLLERQLLLLGEWRRPETVRFDCPYPLSISQMIQLLLPLLQKGYQGDLEFYPDSANKSGFSEEVILLAGNHDTQIVVKWMDRDEKNTGWQCVKLVIAKLRDLRLIEVQGPEALQAPLAKVL